MKKLFSGILIASTLFIACGDASNSSDKPAENKTEVVANATLDLNVEGMACQHNCAGLIEKEVAKMDGVANCSVDFENKTMSVSFDEGATSADDIQNKVHSLADGQYKTSEKKVELKEQEIDEEIEEAVETVELLNVVTMSADKMIYIKEVMKLFESLVDNPVSL